MRNAHLNTYIRYINVIRINSNTNRCISFTETEHLSDTMLRRMCAHTHNNKLRVWYKCTWLAKYVTMHIYICVCAATSGKVHEEVIETSVNSRAAFLSQMLFVEVSYCWAGHVWSGRAINLFCALHQHCFLDIHIIWPAMPCRAVHSLCAVCCWCMCAFYGVF